MVPLARDPVHQVRADRARRARSSRCRRSRPRRTAAPPTARSGVGWHVGRVERARRAGRCWSAGRRRRARRRRGRSSGRSARSPARARSSEVATTVSGIGRPRSRDQRLEGRLVVQARERRERGGEDRRRAAAAARAGSRGRRPPRTPAPATSISCSPRIRSSSSMNASVSSRGRRVDEVAREVLRVAAGRPLVVVGGVDLVAGVGELAHHPERERHPRAGDQDLHRGSRRRARSRRTARRARAPPP